MKTYNLTEYLMLYLKSLRLSDLLNSLLLLLVLLLLMELVTWVLGVFLTLGIGLAIYKAMMTLYRYLFAGFGSNRGGVEVIA